MSRFAARNSVNRASSEANMIQAALNCLLQRIGMTVSMPQIQAAFAPA